MNVLFGQVEKVDAYKMTAQTTKKDSFKDHTGETIKILKACDYESVTRDGNTKTILSIMTDSGLVISGDSKTAQDSFAEMVQIFGEDLKELPVEIVAETSKNGRTFISLQVK